MDNREWQTFVTVVDEGNITRAAEKLFLSQPALSYRLRHMEKALGHSLLLRTADDARSRGLRKCYEFRFW